MRAVRRHPGGPGEHGGEIAKRCNVTVRLGDNFLPNFPTGDMTTEDFLVMKSKRAWRTGSPSCSRIPRCGPSAAPSMTSVSTSSSR